LYVQRGQPATTAAPSRSHVIVPGIEITPLNKPDTHHSVSILSPIRSIALGVHGVVRRWIHNYHIFPQTAR
jgi:hypothetical protein